IAIGIVGALDGSIDVPNSFAVEFAPLPLIAGDRLTLDTYQAHPVRYRTRLSFATQRTKVRARSQIALGVRTSLLDESDPRTSRILLDRLRALLERHARNDDSLEARIEAAGINLLAVDRGSLAPAQRRIVDSLRALHDAVEHSLNTSFANRIKEWDEDSVWNRRMLDLAVAARWSTRDSTARGLRSDAWAAWLTYGTGYHRWLQWLVGTRVALERDSLTSHHIASSAVTTRLYLGANRYKVFGEVQGEARQAHAPVWLLGTGSELALDRSIWLVVYAGWRRDGSDAGQLLTRLGLALGN
ncbi:MAG: hypothetical protein ACRENC_03695, partial [Gemmatimonadaceae bacterium]